MKKAVVAILAFIYLNIASGIVMNLHYCMGQLSSVEYGYNNHDHCSKCGMEEKEGCCNTELKLIKLQDSHQLSKADLSITKTVVSLLPYAEFRFSPAFVQSREINPQYDSPPDRRINSVYLHTGILRI